MKTLQYNPLRPIQDRPMEILKVYVGPLFAGARILSCAPKGLTISLAILLSLFLWVGAVLRTFDPAAGILDIGILTVLLLGLIAGLAAICCSLWLQEILWQPFKTFRKQFRSHFNQLSSWQQCILYFSVFFLLLYAVLWGLAIVL